jgi:hypothetical protein
MKKYHLWVLGILLLVIFVLAALGKFRLQEGFAAEPSAAQPSAASTTALLRGIVRCPPNYSFFSAPDGTSLCCKGTVNPYTGTCEGAVNQADICSLGGKSIKDPRPKFRGQMLKACRAQTIDLLNGNSASMCPTSLPNYAQEDGDNAKCCANPIVLQGENAFACSSQDLKDTTKYCIVTGNPTMNATDGKVERKCDETRLVDAAKCPVDIENRPYFQTVPYTMGAREATAYDVADLNGLTIPTCYRLNEACIPKEAIEYAQKRGAFTNFSADKWEYSCEVWKQKNSGAMVPGMERGYLRSLGTTGEPSASS